MSVGKRGSHLHLSTLIYVWEPALGEPDQNQSWENQTGNQLGQSKGNQPKNQPGMINPREPTQGNQPKGTNPREGNQA